MNRLKISVITVNLNNAEGLRKTIISVINQQFSQLEFLVVDGGSTDESKKVMEQYSDKIHIAISEKDSGIYNAMNKGITKATGDYFLFLNSGDILLGNNTLQQMLDGGDSADLIFGDIKMSGLATSAIGLFPDQLSFKFFYINSLPHPCTLIRKQLFEHVGLYREDFKVAADWAFFVLAVCKYNCSYKHLSLVVADFALGGISSTSKKVIDDEREAIYREHFPAFAGDYKELFYLESELSQAKKQIGYRIQNKLKKIFAGSVN